MQIGGGAIWTIPAMNRSLVEAATHPVMLDALATRLAEKDERWNVAKTATVGLAIAQGQAAQAAIIDWDQPVPDFRIAEDRIGTRLGLGDVEIDFPTPQRGPFPGSEPIPRLVVPAHLLSGARDTQPVDIVAADGVFSFRLNDGVFSYGRYGLERH
jgi:CRISPR-associated endonuclease/helicase Cas3